MPTKVGGITPVLATSEDVLQCYRTILGREPESGDIATHLESAPSIWELIRRFVHSEELRDLMLGPSAKYKFEQRRYLANSFSGKMNYDCFFHHYAFLGRELPPPAFEEMLYKETVLFQYPIDDDVCTASIQISRHNQNEGEFSLQFQTTRHHLYTLSYTIIPGHLLDLPDRDIFLISRMQGRPGTYEQFRHVTKKMNEISPQAVLFAVLRGIAAAVGVQVIAGTSASNNVIYSSEKAELLKQAYDDFFSSIGAAGPTNGFYIFELSARPKPISLVKPGHRLRTRLKRSIKEDIARTSQMTWLNLAKPADSQLSFNYDFERTGEVCLQT